MGNLMHQNSETSPATRVKQLLSVFSLTTEGLLQSSQTKLTACKMCVNGSQRRATISWCWKQTYFIWKPDCQFFHHVSILLLYYNVPARIAKEDNKYYSLLIKCCKALHITGCFPWPPLLIHASTIETPHTVLNKNWEPGHQLPGSDKGINGGRKRIREMIHCFQIMAFLQSLWLLEALCCACTAELTELAWSRWNGDTFSIKPLHTASMYIWHLQVQHTHTQN